MVRRLIRVAGVAFALAMLCAPVAHAVQPDEIMSDPAAEARARHLSQQLRCMVCQNQSIDDSDAPLARDLRVLVRERIKAGDSDNQVLDFLTSRYGDFVLLKPPLRWDTALLWLTPIVVLLIGGGAMVAAALRRRLVDDDPNVPAPNVLSEAERARLAELVESQGSSGRRPTG